MKGLNCKIVLDFIDRNGFKVIPPEISLHLENCESCRKYFQLSMFMKKTLGRIEKVDVRKKLYGLIQNKRFNFRLSFSIGIIVIAVMILIGIFAFNPTNNSRGISGEYVSSSSSVTEETDSLEYFYTIALEM